MFGKERIERYDLIVIGSGAGLNIASQAHATGMRVALLDDGPLGGTCLNRGCIPTKIILYPAEVVETLREAEKVGVEASGIKVDFGLIMKRMHDLVDGDVAQMMRGIDSAEGLDFFNEAGSFVDQKVLKVGDRKITAPTIVIAAGSRESIPPIDGIEDIGYLTSTTALELKTPPKSLVIVGGGYIAAEMATFFSAVGTKVKVVGRNERLVPREEPEVSKELKRRMKQRMEVHTGMEVVSAGRDEKGKFVSAKSKRTKKVYRYHGEEVLIAVGRGSNSDLFHPEKTGVEVDKKGWIKVDGYLRTNVEGIWALGDAIGRNMFRHTANYEADVVWENMNAESEKKMVELDEHAVPHAVFSFPEIASVGLKEEEAVQGTLVVVGEAKYTDAIRGYAMGDEGSFVKVIVDAETRKILGAHAIGPHATAMVQPLVYLMNAGKGTFLPLAKAQTIHPAIEEIMVRAFGNLRPGKGQESMFEHSHAHHHGHSHGHSHSNSSSHDNPNSKERG